MLKRFLTWLRDAFKKLDRKIQIAVVSGLVLFCCIIPYISGSLSPSTEEEESPTQPPEKVVETVVVIITATDEPTAIPTNTEIPTSTPTSLPYVLPESGQCLESLTYMGEAAVSQVIDGDTIEIVVAGTSESVPVRYIGIDSPERDDEYFTESYNFNLGLVQDKRIHLFRDVSELDPFDRFLYYLVAGDQFVNYEMVKSGWARAVEYPPDTSCAASLYEAEDKAIDSNTGVWAALVPVVPTSPPTNPPATIPPTQAPPPPTQPPPQPTQPPANCDPSYPDVCIARRPPDLDCPDIPYRRFRVLPPDPHNFDGDGDGIGCES